MKTISDLKIKKESERLASLYPVDMGKEWNTRYKELNQAHARLRDCLHHLRLQKCDYELGLGECTCKEHPDIQLAALACQESANKINAMWHERHTIEKKVYLHYFSLISGARTAKKKYMSTR